MSWPKASHDLVPSFVEGIYNKVVASSHHFPTLPIPKARQELDEGTSVLHQSLSRPPFRSKSPASVNMGPCTSCGNSGCSCPPGSCTCVSRPHVLNCPVYVNNCCRRTNEVRHELADLIFSTLCRSSMWKRTSPWRRHFGVYTMDRQAGLLRSLIVTSVSSWLGEELWGTGRLLRGLMCRAEGMIP